MSQFVVPNWSLRHQRQDQVDRGEGNRSFHVQNHQIPIHVVPMSDHEAAELTCENGQLATHLLSNNFPAPAPTKPTCGRSGDYTLESIVHQATCHHNHNLMNLAHSPKIDQPTIGAINAASSGEKFGESSGLGQVQMLPNMVKRRLRSETESDQCGRFFISKMLEVDTERSACASASATICRDKDTTMLTWASFEPPSILKTKTTDEDSASHGRLEHREEEQETEGGTVRSCSARRSRAAPRRRRDRINQKLKALQKLVPNASKTDKASMLDEVIEYLKQLQAQVQMISTRTMPQMMMNPPAVQQQLQMSLLAHMGMQRIGVGMGMGMLDMNSMARTAPHSLQPLMPSTLASTGPTFVSPAFVVPPKNPSCIPPPATSTVTTTTINASGSFSDPYCAFLAQQLVNMDFYNKLVAFCRQQANQTAPTKSNLCIQTSTGENES